MASYRILTKNDLRNHYFAIGEEALKRIDINRPITLICNGKVYENRNIDKCLGYGHLYARKEFFDDNKLEVNDRLVFDVEESSNTIKIMVIKSEEAIEFDNLFESGSQYVSFEDNLDNISENYLKNGQYYISKEKYPFDDIDNKKDYIVHFHINDNEIKIEEKRAWSDPNRFMINHMREFYAMMSEKGLKNFVITIDRINKKIFVSLSPIQATIALQHNSSLIKHNDTKDFVIDIETILDKMVGYYKRIFCDKNLLPTNDVDNNRATGFTERNLTFNFCHNYLDLYKEEGIVWQEMPIIGQSRQHIDSVIVHSDTLLLIEAKRLHSPYHYEELASENINYTNREHKTVKYGDLYRLQTYYKDIPLYNDLKPKECYAILLADFFIQRGKNTQSKNDEYRSFYQKSFDNEFLIFKKDNMEYYLYYRIEQIPIN